MTQGNEKISAKLREIGEFLISLPVAGSGTGAEPPELNLIALAPLDQQRRKLGKLARADYADRRSREQFVDSELLSEPAWDILLDLMANEMGGVPTSIKVATIASGVPVTTALRWITVLENCGMVSRSPDSSDGRRWWLHLTRKGFVGVGQYLADRERRAGRKVQFDFEALAKTIPAKA